MAHPNSERKEGRREKRSLKKEGCPPKTVSGAHLKAATQRHSLSPGWFCCHFTISPTSLHLPTRQDKRERYILQVPRVVPSWVYFLRENTQEDKCPSIGTFFLLGTTGRETGARRNHKRKLTRSSTFFPPIPSANNCRSTGNRITSTKRKNLSRRSQATKTPRTTKKKRKLHL